MQINTLHEARNILNVMVDDTLNVHSAQWVKCGEWSAVLRARGAADGADIAQYIEPEVLDRRRLACLKL